MFKMIALKLRKLGSSCYPCLLALTPYDFNVLNIYRVQKNATFEKKKKQLEHSEKKKTFKNKLIMKIWISKMKNLKFLHLKGNMQSF